MNEFDSFRLAKSNRDARLDASAQLRAYRRGPSRPMPLLTTLSWPNAFGSDPQS